MADLPDSGERQLQGSRNGRGREGENVDSYLESTELVFGGDAKALLLIDHDEAEVLPFTSSDRSRWVPITTSTSPVAIPAITCRC